MSGLTIGAIVQMKSGGIHGVVESLLDADSDNPKSWVRWDDGTYSVHGQSELRAATSDGPQLYKKLA
jgi:hypothetical protein